MSFQVIPTGGPMWNEPLSQLRVEALVSVDESAPLPGPVVAYLIALENTYLSMKEQDNREFLRSSWEACGTTPAIKQEHPQ